MLASSNAILLPFASLSVKEETGETRSTMSAPLVEIADLPDELLMSIFKHAKGGTKIGNVRLSCRRFRDTSSHLLLDILDVCLTPESLARAQEISRHPTISKGIRTLQIGLCPLSSALLLDSTFLFAAVTYLREDIRGALQYSVKSQNAILDGKEFSIAAHFVPLWKQRKRLLRSWDSWETQVWSQVRMQTLHGHMDALSIFHSREQTSEVVALRRGYEKYKNAYEWQQRTLEDGTFVQAIVSMME